MRIETGILAIAGAVAIMFGGFWARLFGGILGYIAGSYEQAVTPGQVRTARTAAKRLRIQLGRR